MAAPDPYATAKANLRDNVKTLMAVFAGIAGVLLAGTPFSGLGSLPLSARLAMALACLILAVSMVGWAIRVLLDVLRVDPAYSGALRDGFDPATVADRLERDELTALKAEFERRRHELLPGMPGRTGQVQSIEALEAAIEDLWDQAKVSAANGDPAAEQKMAMWAKYDDALADINHWAAFTRMRRRVVRGIAKVFWIGFLALLFIAAFAWAAAPPKKPEGTSQTVVVEERIRPVERPASAPRFGPVYFEPGKTDLSAVAIARIGEARDHLRQHADTALLVYAYTDTQGRSAFNTKLARDRARAVVQALKEGGGIAPARVFVAELPLTDLPVLTSPQVDNAENRSVWLAVIPAPLR
jgi:outer membrane protein OmpA-like peptidoglycan-associated protein